jgi:hypothetical protein
MKAIIEELLETVFFIGSYPKLYNEHELDNVDKTTRRFIF